MKTLEKHGKQLVEFNALVNGNHYNIYKDGILLEKQKEMIDELINERVYKIYT